MRSLANENFPDVAVAALAADGHDVVWIRVEAPGLGDPDVLAAACRFDRGTRRLARPFLGYRAGPCPHASIDVTRA
jgi:hypothetical protein